LAKSPPRDIVSGNLKYIGKNEGKKEL